MRIRELDTGWHTMEVAIEVFSDGSVGVPEIRATHQESDSPQASPEVLLVAVDADNKGEENHR
jgi:hypothetical protein